MRLSEYGVLENNDRFKKGDEVRNTMPYSHITQLADADLDHERMAWKSVEPYWIGRRFGSYRERTGKPTSFSRGMKVSNSNY